MLHGCHVVLHSKSITLTKVVHFSKSYYHTKFEDLTVSSASAVPTPEVRMVNMLVLQMV